MAEMNGIGNKWLAKTEADAKASVDRLKKIWSIDLLTAERSGQSPGSQAQRAEATHRKTMRRLRNARGS